MDRDDIYRRIMDGDITAYGDIVEAKRQAGLAFSEAVRRHDYQAAGALNDQSLEIDTIMEFYRSAMRYDREKLRLAGMTGRKGRATRFEKEDKLKAIRHYQANKRMNGRHTVREILDNVFPNDYITERTFYTWLKGYNEGRLI